MKCQGKHTQTQRHKHRKYIYTFAKCADLTKGFASDHVTMSPASEPFKT